MRMLFIMLAMAAVLPFCTKKKRETTGYIGTWELRSSNGMMGHQEHEPGNGFTLVITKDSLYEYGNGVLQYTRVFSVVKDTLRGYGADRIADRLLPDIATGLGTFLELNEDTLTRYVGIPALDGGNSVYVKVK